MSLIDRFFGIRSRRMNPLLVGTWAHRQVDSASGLTITRAYTVRYGADGSFDLRGRQALAKDGLRAEGELHTAGRASLTDGVLTHAYQVNELSNVDGDPIPCRVLKAVHDKEAQVRETVTRVKNLSATELILFDDKANRDLIFTRQADPDDGDIALASKQGA